MSVKIIVKSQETLRHLGNMELRAKNLTGLMRDFGGYMKGSIERNFAAGGRPVKWRPLSLGQKMIWHEKRSTWSTKSGKMTKSGAAAWRGRIPLTDTGRLRRSITYQATTNSMSIGTNLEYAQYHQYGSAGGKIPARPFLLFQTEDLEYFTKRAAQYVIGK